jgi:hypothetical protein
VKIIFQKQYIPARLGKHCLSEEIYKLKNEIQVLF